MRMEQRRELAHYARNLRGYGFACALLRNLDVDTHVEAFLKADGLGLPAQNMSVAASWVIRNVGVSVAVLNDLERQCLFLEAGHAHFSNLLHAIFTVVWFNYSLLATILARPGASMVHKSIILEGVKCF